MVAIGIDESADVLLPWRFVLIDVSRILTKWANEGARLNPGASIDQIVQLERCVGAPLPHILRDLYSTANGMVDGAVDVHWVSFWPIEKIVARSYVVESGPTKGIGFADVLIHSWFLLFDVRASTLVVVNEATSKAQTPEAFVADYLDRPRDLNL